MNKKTIIIDFISIILIIAMTVSGYKIVTKVIDYHKSSETYNNIRKNYSPSLGNNISIDEQKLKNINGDYIMWLNVDGTNIDYPVVVSSDNDFYLERDFYKNDSSSGSIFMDYRNKTDYKNIILYGHNMRNQTMFNNLEKFKDNNFWNEKHKIYIYRDGYKYTYEPFSVYVAEPSLDYTVTDFSKDITFSEYLKKCSDLSIFDDSIYLKNPGLLKGFNISSERILTLSTCSYEFDDARTVVHARLIDKSEI